MDRSPQDKLNDLTVVNLKEIARQIGVLPNGTKVELVARILSVGEDKSLSAYEYLLNDIAQDLVTSVDAGVSEQQSSSSGGVTLRSGAVIVALHGPAVSPEFMEREIAIRLRRENALLERELSLVRREASMAPSIEDGNSDRIIDSRVNI